LPHDETTPFAWRAAKPSRFDAMLTTADEGLVTLVGNWMSWFSPHALTWPSWWSAANAAPVLLMDAEAIFMMGEVGELTAAGTPVPPAVATPCAVTEPSVCSTAKAPSLANTLAIGVSELFNLAGRSA
jgi:hypothetical protein